MKETEKLADGYTCACGEYHKFALYVYAHWREVLTHECEKCGRKNKIVCGTVRIARKGKAPNDQAEASGARGRPIANPDAPAALPPAHG